MKKSSRSSQDGSVDIRRIADKIPIGRIILSGSGNIDAICYEGIFGPAKAEIFQDYHKAIAWIETCKNIPLCIVDNKNMIECGKWASRVSYYLANIDEDLWIGVDPTLHNQSQVYSRTNPEIRYGYIKKAKNKYSVYKKGNTCVGSRTAIKDAIILLLESDRPKNQSAHKTLSWKSNVDRILQEISAHKIQLEYEISMDDLYREISNRNQD